MHFLSKSATVTKKFAVLLAAEIKKYKPKAGALIIGLSGELGSGKTTFSQGFAHGLGLKRQVTSPTFLIIRNYELRSKNYEKFYHIDCYRLKNAKELLALGFKEISANPKNIVLIEWADKIKRLILKNSIWINFKHGKRTTERIIEIRLIAKRRKTLR